MVHSAMQARERHTPDAAGEGALAGHAGLVPLDLHGLPVQGDAVELALRLRRARLALVHHLRGARGAPAAGQGCCIRLATQANTALWHSPSPLAQDGAIMLVPLMSHQSIDPGVCQWDEEIGRWGKLSSSQFTCAV